MKEEVKNVKLDTPTTPDQEFKPLTSEEQAKLKKQHIAQLNHFKAMTEFYQLQTEMNNAKANLMESIMDTSKVEIEYEEFLKEKEKATTSEEFAKKLSIK